MRRRRSITCFGILSVTCGALAGGETVIVTTLHDIRDFGGAKQLGDLPGPDGKVSFGEAIEATNNTPGPQAIHFTIPPSEYWLLPEIALLELDIGPFVITDDGLTIDFRTQTAFAGDTNPEGWEVGIYGLQPNGWGSPAIFLQADQCTLIGLDDVYQRGHAVEVNGNHNRILGFTTDGPWYSAINVEGWQPAEPAAFNIIGGTGPGEGNVVSGGNGGISITSPAHDNVVIGNSCVGSPSYGIAVVAASRYGYFASNNRIGGPTPAERNWCAGNGSYGEEGFPQGVQITVEDADGTIVEGNYVGTTQDGMADYPVERGPGGIAVRAARGTIVRNNLVSGILQVGANHYQGQRFGTAIGIGDVSEDTLVVGNLLGTDALGVNPIPNVEGIAVAAFTARLLPIDTFIGGTGPGEGNTIAFSERAGILVEGLVGTVSIRGNSIFGNGDLGIDLHTYQGGGLTLNDPDDVDTQGGNHLQNFPVVAGATSGGSAVEIFGTLNSTPMTQFDLDFYASQACDPSGHGEGAAYLGSTTVATDAGGDAAFDVTLAASVPVGWSVTATATNVTLGETSEFSACVPVAGGECAADFNGDGLLNVFDYLAFQTLFSNEDARADLAAPFGVFNVFDFLAFQTAFSEGC